jgi:hypothetical protein
MRLMPDGQLIQPALRRLRRAFAGVLAVSLAILAPAPGVFAQNYPAVDLNSTPASAPATTASTPAPAAESLSSNRFLFVVDTSAPMRQHLHDIIGVEETILRSAASGQLRNGDSIGVWTFNEDVYTGTMPLQTWSANDSEEIALRIAEFIRQQDFSKKSRLDLAMAPVAKVVKLSDIITVFVISSGAGPIRGTPYDDDINAQYQLCLRDMGKKPMPLVTVLQGKRGKFIRYTVNALPWPVIIPELPISLKIADESPAAAPTNQAIAATAAATPTQPVTPPPQRGFASPPYAFPPTTPAPTPPVAAPVVQPQSAPPAVTAVVPVPAPPVVTAPAPQPAPPAMPAPVPPPVAPPVAPVTVAETPAPAAPVTPAAPPAVEVRPATSGELPLVPPRSPPLVRKTLPATGVMAQDAAPATPAPAAVPAARAPVVAAAPAQTAPAAPVQAPSRTLVAQATALIKSFTGNHRSLLLIGGVSLLVVATGLILLLARRSRSPGRVSLISQTMDDRRP